VARFESVNGKQSIAIQNENTHVEAGETISEDMPQPACSGSTMKRLSKQGAPGAAEKDVRSNASNGSKRELHLRTSWRREDCGVGPVGRSGRWCWTGGADGDEQVAGQAQARLSVGSAGEGNRQDLRLAEYGKGDDGDRDQKVGRVEISRSERQENGGRIKLST